MWSGSFWPGSYWPDSFWSELGSSPPPPPPGPDNSLEPLRIPYQAAIVDKDSQGQISKPWLQYFQQFAQKVVNGAVNFISGTTDRITISGTQTAPVIDISENYVGQDSITTLGTIGEGVWQGTPVAAPYGGTGQSSYVLGDTLYASASTVLSKLPGTTAAKRSYLGQFGTGSVSAAPEWIPDTVFNVKDYGAVGDGVTDDGPAIRLAIAAAPSTACIYFPPGFVYKVSGLLAFTKTAYIQAYGAKLLFNVDAADQGVRMTASRTKWRGGYIQGAQNTVNTDTQNGLQAYGADSSHYLTGIDIEDIEFSDWGNYGLSLQFLQNFTVDNIESHDIRYAGVAGLSLRYGKITNQLVYDIHPTGSSNSGDNAYGLFVSKETGSEADHPESHDVLLQHIIARNVKTWEGIDTHGGYNIVLDDFIVDNCRFGVAFGSYIGTTGSYRACSYSTVSNGVIRNNTSTGVPREYLGAGIVFNGRFQVDNIRGKYNKISNVIIEGYAPYDTAHGLGGAGTTPTPPGYVIGSTGAIELQYQDGMTVEDVTIVDSGIMGIRWISSINSQVSRIKLKTLTGDAWVKSSGLFAFAVNPTAGDTFTVNGRIYTFRAAASLDTEITIGANLTATLTAAATLLNADTDGRVSTCTYASTATTLTVTADTPGKSLNSAYFPLAASVAAVTAMSGGNATDGAVGVYFQSLAGEATGNSGTLEDCEFDIGSNICIGSNGDQASVNFKGNWTKTTTSTLYAITGSGSGGAQNGAGNIRDFTPIQYTQTIPDLAGGESYSFYVPAPGCPSGSFCVIDFQFFQVPAGLVIGAIANNNYVQFTLYNPNLFNVVTGSTRRFSAFIHQIISGSPVAGAAVYSKTTTADFTLPTNLAITGSLQVGAGSAAASASRLARLSGTLTGSGTTQWGEQIDVTGNSSATVALNGKEVKVTGAASTVHAILRGLLISSPVLGAGGSATNAYGLNVGDINVGSTGNWAILTNLGLVQFGDLLLECFQTGITASTTQTQGQGPLTKNINIVSTVANANDTVTLPSAAAGLSVFIRNNGAQTLKIFPASGDNINGTGVNAAVTLAAGASVTYQTADTTNWYS